MTARPGFPPAVTVHGLAGACAALAAAGPRGVLLLSAPGAGGFAGPAWFLGMIAAAAAAHPGIPLQAALDCADAPGTALAALRAGARLVVLDHDSPGYAAVAAAAAEIGARLLPARPPSLDLGRVDLRRRDDLARLVAWLAMEAPQDGATSPAA
ncbi:hypothetical protein [Roseomonas sp. CECT 9278]|uniref:hypothetical protein n=1 Tax=Roseomonas sp. CECT 9278 TaxID=2845823 RepID=UPI001E2F18E5|nr:hypothetical protein [Roseomonas sp. CECT 9278]